MVSLLFWLGQAGLLVGCIVIFIGCKSVFSACSPLNIEPAEWSSMRLFEHINIINMPINVEPIFSAAYGSQPFRRGNAWAAKGNLALGGHGYSGSEKIWNAARQIGISEIIGQGIPSWHSESIRGGGRVISWGFARIFYNHLNNIVQNSRTRLMRRIVKGRSDKNYTHNREIRSQFRLHGLSSLFVRVFRGSGGPSSRLSGLPRLYQRLIRDQRLLSNFSPLAPSKIGVEATDEEEQVISDDRRLIPIVLVRSAWLNAD